MKQQCLRHVSLKVNLLTKTSLSDSNEFNQILDYSDPRPLDISDVMINSRLLVCFVWGLITGRTVQRRH